MYVPAAAVAVVPLAVAAGVGFGAGAGRLLLTAAGLVLLGFGAGAAGLLAAGLLAGAGADALTGGASTAACLARIDSRTDALPEPAAGHVQGGRGG